MRRVHLKTGGDEGVLGDGIEGDGVVEHIACHGEQHLILRRAGGGERLPRGIGHGEHRGRGEEAPQGGQKGRRLQQRRAVQRWHAEFLRACEGIGFGQDGPGQVLADAVLGLGQPGNEVEIGGEGMVPCHLPQPCGAIVEQPGEVRHAREGRGRDFSDGNGVMARRGGTDLGHAMASRTARVT